MKRMTSFSASIFCLCTAMVGYQIHHDGFWAVMDFFFAPIAWCKWLIFQEVNLSIIRNTFSFFVK